MLKRIVHIITSCMIAMSLLVNVVSCGLLDFDAEESVLAVYDMRLDRDTVYVMAGDSFSLSPVFLPEQPYNSTVYWQSNDDGILKISDNKIVASKVGSTYVKATSVIQAIEDSCYVCVMPDWKADPYAYQSEMMVYASVSVNGKPFDPSSMRIAAFVGDECRGEGVVKEYMGVRFVQFRIWGDMPYASNMPELIRFRLYYHTESEFICDYLPLSLYFDGNSVGTLSNLFYLSY